MIIYKSPCAARLQGAVRHSTHAPTFPFLTVLTGACWPDIGTCQTRSVDILYDSRKIDGFCDAGTSTRQIVYMNAVRHSARICLRGRGVLEWGSAMGASRHGSVWDRRTFLLLCESVTFKPCCGMQFALQHHRLLLINYHFRDCKARLVTVIYHTRWVTLSANFTGNWRSSTSDCWRQKTRVSVLSRGVDCVFQRLAVLTQYRRVTDGWTNGHSGLA